MRIIGGEFRSRRLKTLPGMTLRPTPDRLREALFNVIAPRIAGCTFLDAYAGCGAVGIEALSRGAGAAIFLEKHPGAVRIIHQNLASLGLEARARVIRGDAAAHVRKLDPDIAFLDPPYDLEREYERVLALLGEKPPALVIAQHDAHQALREFYGRLRRVRTLRHGGNVLAFFEPEA